MAMNPSRICSATAKVPLSSLHSSELPSSLPSPHTLMLPLCVSNWLGGSAAYNNFSSRSCCNVMKVGCAFIRSIIG